MKSKEPYIAILMILLIQGGFADIGPGGYTRMDSVGALSWFVYIISVAVLIAVSKNNRLIVRSFQALMFLWAAVAFLGIDYLYGILVMLLWVLGEALGIGITAVAASRGKPIKNQPVLILFLLLIIVLAQFNMFGNASRSNNHLIVTGFVKMQPITPSVDYVGRNFNASFVNIVDRTISFRAITLNETITNKECLIVAPKIGDQVKSGGTFNVAGICPQKTDGEAFDMIVRITYNALMEDVNVTHTDNGHIKWISGSL